jgi:hypothetical protein
MRKLQTNTAAFMRGEQRGTRFRYRHTPAGAAQEAGLPEEWVWLWVETGLLRSQNWLKRVWVRLQDVEALLNERKWLSKITPFVANGVDTVRPFCWRLKKMEY